MCEAEKEAMVMFPLDAKNMFPAAEKSGFSYIWKAYKPYIRYHL